MKVKKNIQILSPHNRAILLDVFYEENDTQKPVVIFSHGFKGFKDWGTFDLIGEYLAENGFCFIKFNFSHNGTSPDKPDEFVDLEAFGDNNFTKELDDLGAVIDWVEKTEDIPEKEIQRDNINLIGHSRGGGITILRAYEDDRARKGISWSAPKDFESRWPEEALQGWKENGIIYVENARTGQQLPMYYQFIEDLRKNKKRLSIENAIKNMDRPFMVAHGTEDEAVPFEDALEMKKWNGDIKLELVPNAGHTYGGKHPYESNQLPQSLRYLLNACISFLKSNSK